MLEQAFYPLDFNSDYVGTWRFYVYPCYDNGIDKVTYECVRSIAGRAIDIVIGDPCLLSSFRH